MLMSPPTTAIQVHMHNHHSYHLTLSLTSPPNSLTTVLLHLLEMTPTNLCLSLQLYVYNTFKAYF